MFGVDDAAVALIGAGAISTAGSLYTNSANRKFQGEVNQESINLANTAHQREIADLRAAGLNPILSASGAGASVPSLGSASLINPGQGLSDGISSAAKFFSDEYKANINNVKANTENTNLLNTAQSWDNRIKHDEYKVLFPQLKAESELARAKELATNELLGIKKNFDGTQTVNWRKYNAVKKEMKAGIMSDLKLKANQNMRANIKSAADVLNGAAENYLDYKSRKFRR